MSHDLPGQREVGEVTPHNCLFNQSDHALYSHGILDATNSYAGGNTNKVDEIRAGTPLARITATKKHVPTKRSQAVGAGNASQSLIVRDAGAFKTTDTLTIGGNQVFRIGGMKDNDNAASTGLAVYLHLDELSESPFGHLESVTAGNADAYFAIGNGGPLVKVEDDDAAATGGVAIYYDEDAANPDERFLANVPTGKDAFILASDGRAIRIKYNGTPGTPGVQIYFDDDAANNYERLLFVSPTNANGVYHTDDSIAVETGYVTRTTTAAITAIDYTTNTITLTAAATWADGDAVYCDSLPGSEITRTILNETVRLMTGIAYETTWRDKRFSKGIFHGVIDNTLIYGDLTAIRAAEAQSSTKYLKGIYWADEQGLR